MRLIVSSCYPLKPKINYRFGPICPRMVRSEMVTCEIFWNTLNNFNKTEFRY